jgi:homoserine kinase
MTLLVSAPATTANIGSGFDCAAVALELRNEVEIEPGDGSVEIEGEGATELPRDATHLSLRAFALLAPPDDWTFRFVNRIPLERGLGSSAAAIALGLVAGQAAADADLSLEELLALGAPLEGHADNLAAALAGGACLTWREDERHRLALVADELPLHPVSVSPTERVATAASRGRLPLVLAHEQAAVAASRAALLGAALASGDTELLRPAFDDVLHEPFRLDTAPLLRELRERPPEGAAGVTLSGSGPTVIAWAYPAEVDACVADLAARFADAVVRPLAVAGVGAVAREEVVA